MEEKNPKKEIIKVEPKPIVSQEAKNLTKQKLGNVKIDKINKLTLNIFVEPLKKRFGQQYKENKFLLVTDIILAVIILILIGTLLNIFIFSHYLKINLMALKVTANPAALINGQTAEFTIDYSNNSKDTLNNVALVLKTPVALQNPTYDLKEFDAKTNTLQIGDLASKAHGQFKVKGLLLGNFNEKQEFLTVINYKNKYNQERQEFFSNQFQLTASVLQASLNLPEKIIATSYFTTQVTLKNQADLDLSQFKIKVVWPEGFIFKDSDLGQPGPEQTWPLDKILPSQEQNYNFNGKILNKKLSTLTFFADIYATYNQTEYLLTEVSKTVPLELSKFELDFINPEKSFSVSPGQEIAYTLHYKNKENYALENVEIGLNLAGEFVEASRTLSFNQNQKPQLAKIEPQAEDTLEIKVKTKPGISYSIYQEDGYPVAARIFAVYDDPIQKNRITIEGEPFYTKVDSQISLDCQGIFFTPQGDQLGVGSVPPKIGEYTSYWAIIRVKNTNNQIKNLKLTAKVPAGIEFTNISNVTDGNQIIFNENSRLLEWSVDNIAALAGIFNSAPEVRIQLAITPTADLVGKSPLLLTNISATATDAITDAFLQAVGKDISIAIFPDESLNKVIE